jgi:hypothetical protein
MNADKTKIIYISFDPRQSALIRSNFFCVSAITRDDGDWNKRMVLMQNLAPDNHTSVVPVRTATGSGREPR